MTKKKNPPTPPCSRKSKEDSPRIGKTVYPQAVVECCGCHNEIEPSQVASCPHCAGAGTDWRHDA